MAWSAEATYLVAAAAVQGVLAVAILVRRPRVEWAVVLAGLFLGNGALAINAMLVAIDTAWWDGDTAGRVFFDFDRLTTLLILYLALAYPRRPRWARRPLVLPSLFAVMAATVYVPHAANLPFQGFVLFPPPGCLDPCVGVNLRWVWTYHLSNVGFVVLLLRWAYLLPRTTSPTELAQFRLLFAAFAIRAVHVELLVYRAGPLGLLVDWDPYVLANPWYGLYLVRGTVTLLAVMGAILLLLHHRRRLPSDRRRAVDFVLAWILVGGIEFVLQQDLPLFGRGADYSLYFYSPLLNLDVLIVRPILVAYAMLRYDFLGSWARRAPATLTLAGVLAAIGYTSGLLPTLQSTIGQVPGTWAAILVGLILGAITALILQTYVLAPQRGAAERYVALLEDAYRNRPPGTGTRVILQADRKRLGIPEPEADALEQAVASRWDGAPLWLPGQRIAGRYDLQRVLGTGGSGEALLADDLVTGEAVVLKRTRRLGPQERKAALAEAYALTKLSHPNLVPLLRTEIVDSEPVLVLAYMPGGSLASRLAAGRLPRDVALRALDDLLGALEVVHHAGFVHGDVKPSNVLFDADGRARLADFGLARPMVPAGRIVADATPTTGPGGTVRYLAPEQVRGGAPTTKSDLYAAAVVALECLTGHHPVPPGLPDYEQRRRIAEARVEVPDSLGRLADVLRHATEPDPTQRIDSAAAFRKGLA